MKCEEVNIYLLSIALALLISGCGTSGNGVGKSESAFNSSRVVVDNPSIDLTDYLRRIPGVQVTGHGANARITIRGINTFLGNPSPLFVIDGIRIGRDFSSVYGFININDIGSIEVLKGPEASAYGVEGGGGVVLFHTRS
ncbi:TonB-dependent receptor plug domain-containing protein [Halalkalibaculum sp. DA3122]|uniref:TonB-dependent receptor plug domain-containing protein n=1 Tax=unclassified Halalkalibaculum TaxID=2964617 RepID=UPI00375508D1